MTIRDYVKRRIHWGFWIAIVSWLFLALTSNMGFGGAILSFMFIRCPKCRA